MTSLQFTISVFALAIFSTVVGVTTIVPKLREAIRERFLNQERTVLAKVDGDLSGKKDDYVVIKVKTPDTLSLEIYGKNPEQEELVFQKRIVLPERRDGYFTFQGRDTNLVLADIDHDGGMEILAPAFDENLIPRLNVYKYDPNSQTFMRLGPDAMKL